MPRDLKKNKEKKVFHVLVCLHFTVHFPGFQDPCTLSPLFLAIQLPAIQKGSRLIPLSNTHKTKPVYENSMSRISTSSLLFHFAILQSEERAYIQFQTPYHTYRIMLRRLWTDCVIYICVVSTSIKYFTTKKLQLNSYDVFVDP